MTRRSKQWLKTVRDTLSPGARRRSRGRKLSRLGLEQLEARTMFATGVFDEGLDREAAEVQMVSRDGGAIFGGGITTVPANPAPDAALALTRLTEQLRSLATDSLERLGTIDLRSAGSASTTVTAGVHLLRQGVGSFAPPAAPQGWTASLTGIRGMLGDEANDGEESGAALTSNPWDATLVLYQNAQLTDTAVIIGEKVIFDDVLLLSDNITQFIVVAETVENAGDARIQWIHAGSAADGKPALPAAAKGQPSYNPTTAGPSATFERRSGGAGSDGAGGQKGNTGISAPDVFFFVKHFTLEPNATSSADAYQVSLPDIDLRGQAGGQGQTGQTGGAGGDGAKGLKAHSGQFDCQRGPGYGGHGGQGGDGGNGGQGGIGGSGGHIVIQYVEAPTNANLYAAEFRTAGGAAGNGGRAGAPGQGGRGGEAGEPDPNWCDARPGRRGDHGSAGTAGAAGKAGLAGAGGGVALKEISLSVWEGAFTRPYLVRGEDAHVGETIVFDTYNISGAATLHATDDLSGESFQFPLQELGGDHYGWTVPETLTAGQFTVSIVRQHDGRETNTYRVEVLPVIEAIRFVDAFDAQPGGQAVIVGLGLRSGSDILYDGHRIIADAAPVEDQVDLATVFVNDSASDTPVVRDVMRFTIPVLATGGDLFARDGGLADHTVILDQPFPLANSDPAALTLKRHDGLTFQPSVNGFEFENSEMFDAVEQLVTKDGFLGGLFGDSAFGGDAYRLFQDIYGAGEVEALGGLTSPWVWANYGLWYSYFAGDSLGTETGTGACFGLSNLSLYDFFHGITSEQGKTTDDMVRGAAVLHGKQISDEIMTLQVAELLLDGISPALGGPTMTEITVRYLANFFRYADQGDHQFAPTISFIPNADVLTQSFNLLGEAVNLWDGVTPQESWNDLDEAYHRMTQAINRSHVVTPYRVVYDDPSDSLPSRIYFYDSNEPTDNDIHLDIYRAAGRVQFKYVNGDEERYSSNLGFMLGVTPMGMATGDVDLLLDEDLQLILGGTLGLPHGPAIVQRVEQLLGEQFLTGAPIAAGSAVSEGSATAILPVATTEVRWDVDGDSLVGMSDLLAVVQFLRTNNQSQPLPETPSNDAIDFVDVNGDGVASVADLLDVVREIRDRRSAHDSLTEEGEGGVPAALEFDPRLPDSVVLAIAADRLQRA